MIDLDFLGINGVEPDFIKTGKAKAMADEYGFWDKIVEGRWSGLAERTQHVNNLNLWIAPTARAHNHRFHSYFKSWKKDPVARRYMEDPLLAYREWEDYSPSK